ncbi:BLUF domain-containing protein [Winogradskyella ursingii]|uniref:BLUF domain-containing protein n=1 Tax=Winogradskyella ursingii TaxID=2686079 RepID=UPI0015C6E547|nr:BLUF domain-containing protein [Winogradskyella ursingii]
MFYSVIYQSKAQPDFNLKKIELMLLKAKRKNKRLKISGCIVYCNNRFIQLIQGSKADIQQLYSEIRSDNRHRQVTTLLEQSSEHKIWSDWSMALLDFSGDSKQIMYSRILLESYLGNVNQNEKNSEAFKVFRSSVDSLLRESEPYTVG